MKGLIWCLNFKGHPLTEELRAFLFWKVWEMFNENKRTKSLNSHVSSGIMKTKWERKSIGGITGYFFTADVDWMDKSTSIDFVCREIDLERAFSPGSFPNSPFNSISLN